MLSRTLLFSFVLVGLCACSDDDPLPERKTITEVHAKEVLRIVEEDVDRHLAGVKKAADKLAPGFAVEDDDERASQMRTALFLVGKPPRGITELVASPRSFLAAVGKDGKVFAIDAKKEKDKMSGFDAGAEFGVVKKALAGEAGYAIEEFPPIEEGGEGSTSLVFAAPAEHEGEVVGAVMAGIPLWKLSQRITRQVRLDHAKEKKEGVILWVYLYRGDELHHFGTPPDLDSVVPDGEARREGLSKNPDGFTGQLMQFGRWYGYGVVPLRKLGPKMGAVIFRSNP